VIVVTTQFAFIFCLYIFCCCYLLVPLQVPGANEQGIRLGSYIPWFEPVLWVSFNTLIPWHCLLGDMKGSWSTRTCAINPQRISSGTNLTNGERIPKRKPAKSLRLTRNGRWNEVVVVMLMVVVTCYFFYFSTYLVGGAGSIMFLDCPSVSACMWLLSQVKAFSDWLDMNCGLLTQFSFVCIFLMLDRK